MADNMEMPDDLKKLKVPELKQALKDKGLSTSGTKPDLIKRLVESMGSSVDSSDPVLDEDEILKDDPTPSSTTVPPKPSSKVSTTEESDNKANGVAINPEGDLKQMAADTTAVAKPSVVNKLTEAERLKLRAEKFGVASEKAKKDLRAQRFGISPTENKSGVISSSNPPVDVEKLKKRAERFGISASQASLGTEDDKKRKRAERFGVSLTTSTKSSVTSNSTDSELEAKKRKRAERFGLT